MSHGGAGETARPGGQAKGGVTPQPDDPDTPAAARARQRVDNDAHRDSGHGDHKGGDAL